MSSKGLYFLGVLLVLAKTESNSPRLKISQGELEGKISLSRNGMEYSEFLGIPYGKVPLRFQSPQPADGWKGVRNATQFGARCAQFDMVQGATVGEEDCLFLNVYTPKFSLESGKLLPVMMFIHGGGYTFGSGMEYGGKYFMDHEVILVTINYRVGPMGFLNAGVNEAKGNQGLKDQVMALKWVQKNIAEFGGDPTRTVIFGESAGASAVSQLILSPMAKGLFSGGISQSGVAGCPWEVKNEPGIKQAQMLASKLDCPSSNPQYMVECLRRINAKDIVDATKFTNNEWPQWESKNTPQFGPTLEKLSGNGDNSDVFYSEDSHKLLKEGRFNKVPYIIGFNSHEGLSAGVVEIILDKNATKRIHDQWGRYASSTFFYQKTAVDPSDVSKKLKDFYFRGRNSEKDTIEAVSQIFSDRWFFHCTKELGELYAKHAPVYLYNFTQEGINSFTDLFNYTSKTELKPPTHVDEIQYLFSSSTYHPDIEVEDSSFNFSNLLLKLWTSFAKNGKPTDLWGPAKEWSAVDPDVATPPKWYQINMDSKFSPPDAYFTSRMDFWDNLAFKSRYNNSKEEL